MIVFRIILWFVFLSWSSLAFCQTILPEYIEEEMVLTREDGPYLASNDILVAPEGKLTVLEGVEINIAKDVKLTVHGILEVNGRENMPVIFKPLVQGNTWNGIRFFGIGGENLLEHCTISGATPVSSSDTLAAITAFDVKLELNQVKFLKNRRCFYSESSNVYFRSCVFEENNGEVINIKRTSEAIVENCFFNFSKGGDAIDFDRVGHGKIIGNTILGGDDDGIDVGENTGVVEIFNNTIAYFADNAITIAESSFAEVNYNVLAFSKRGLEAKDGGMVTADHNTIHGHTDAGVGAYELVVGKGGGQLSISNTIISGIPDPLIKDDLSVVTFEYCLTDRQSISGQNNLWGDPDYADPAQLNFSLCAASQAIDKGDPNYFPDPDGSLSDIGAKYFNGGPEDKLIGNFPNPFVAETYFAFYLSREAEVKFRVFEISGRLVDEVLPGVLTEGIHHVLYVNGERFKAGFVEMIVDGKSVAVKKLVSH